MFDDDPRFGCTQPACDPDHRHSPRDRSGRGRLCLARGCSCPGTDYAAPSGPVPSVSALREALEATTAWQALALVVGSRTAASTAHDIAQGMAVHLARSD